VFEGIAAISSDTLGVSAAKEPHADASQVRRLGRQPPLTPAEVSNVAGYLASRYGLALLRRRRSRGRASA